MNEFNHKLTGSLHAGFIDNSIASSKEYLPQLLVNSEGKKVLTTIVQELNRCEEFWFSVAFVTTSGIATLISTLIELERKGIKGKILVSQYLNFTQPEALRRLLQFKNIELKIAVENAFHSKGYLFKKGDLYNLIIGSSNLTASALCENIEWNLKITATPVSYIIHKAIHEFTSEFEKGIKVVESFLQQYETLYNKQVDFSKRLKIELAISGQGKIKPNPMQETALENIQKLRIDGKRKALLISATGTGKTFLSAFDVKKVNPKKFLFVVHRLNIAETSMRAYQLIFGKTKTMGIYSGSQKDLTADFIFCTIQTLSKEEHLKQFERNHFEYIVIDETHRAGAESYQTLLNYFEPKFLLGMTATPERTDGLDVFKQFDYNIAYEIRLHRALEEKMLSPFHYYGVTDISVDGKTLEENSDFKLLTSDERITRIIQNANLFSCDQGRVRGLIFCSKVEECKSLSEGFNQRGFKTIALAGNNLESERAAAIELLESDDSANRLDYIFTVDIFNEGIDIPSVNQIIMLRPTQSAIVFVQQLGRGLRKIEDKEYLTVIDFIGNYSNNFLVPIALYGDTSYNKDSLRKFMTSGSSLIPGTSTINFDKITKDRIFAAIDTANLQQKKDLVDDYNLLKFRLGRIPMMVDFIEQGSRDPQLFVNYSRSYFNFVSTQETGLREKITPTQSKLLELFSTEIANGKRIEEIVILKLLLEKKEINFKEIQDFMKMKFEIRISKATIDSCIRNLNFDFVRKPQNIVTRENDKILFQKEFIQALENLDFKNYFIDLLNYAELKYDAHFSNDKFIDGFILYQKYSRKDVCRILNWENNEDSTMFGYRIKYQTCPIFVNYHKEENIAASTKFEDGFINNNQFQWFSKPRRNLTSEDVKAIKNHNNELRLSLFIKKSNGEGDDFYYMGEVKPIDDSFEESTIPDDHGQQVSVVKIKFDMLQPVEDSIYEYITQNQEEDEMEKVELDSAPTKILPFTIVPDEQIKQYVNCIPLYDVSAAAGPFKGIEGDYAIDWIELSNLKKYSDEYFVIRVLGESMNKKIPNNSYCLFKKDTGGSRNGKIVLVQHQDIQDQNYGIGLTVKEYHSTKKITEELWQHESITLKPKSTDSKFKDIVVDVESADEFRILGIFERVLGE
ncbi:MAG: DUF3427 domain-containing protein [Bacteroidia bacterium]